MIKRDLLKQVEDELNDTKVKDVRIGFSYTAVWLQDLAAGVSFSFRRQVGHYCELKSQAGELHKMSALDLAELALKPRTIDSVVGMAAINAALVEKVSKSRCIKGDFLDHVGIRSGEKWGMVGNFCPLVDRLGDQVELHVFERELSEDYLYPDWAAPQYLPEMDVVVLSGTTVTNNTFERLAELSRKARELVVLGPSTPLAVEIMADHGVTLLAGIAVDEPEKIMNITGQGGGTRQLLTAAHKVNLAIN